jgi:uncharacterized repeat protein (TIGR01451 family)
MNNKTTATAITSNGQPAPAGLSTGPNSAALQATLLSGADTFSNPLLFNNIFWDNRAGSRGLNTVIGIGTTGDLTPINYWDIGSIDAGILLSPTNSILHNNTGVNASPTNVVGADPVVVATHDIPMTFSSWRTNINFIGAIMVTSELPPTLMGNYHLLDATSPAYNAGAISKTVGALTVNAPLKDIDGDGRPALGGFDRGADEIRGLEADLSISKTDGATSVNPGAAVNYTIVVSNGGPDNVTAAPVTDTFPASLTVGSWTCLATAGSSCTVAGTGNNRTGTVTLINGGSATFTANTTLAANATGTLANTATVAAPANTSDSNPSNNSATDTDTITAPANKHIGDLDRTSITLGNLPWTASVTIAVHNSTHAAVSGATVTGTWSGGGSGGTSCTTTNSGQCTVVRFLIPFGQTSNTFTVTNVTGANGSGAYVAANNHDPDVGAQASNGTTIIVPR